VKQQRGFTLLEVLVASLIMGIAVTGLLAAISTSMRNASRLTSYDRALILARQKMDELIVAVNPPTGVLFQGEWPAEVPGQTPTGWKAIITNYDVPPQATPGTEILQRVQLDILWQDGDKQKSFQIEGYRRGVIPRAAVGP
jgi:general secretion pathway protein I